MFYDYVATKTDFNAIEAGIKACWGDELKTIFTDKKKLAQILIVSYDKSSMYLWASTKLQKYIQTNPMPCRLTTYRLYKISHHLQIPDDIQSYWRAGLLPKQLRRTLNNVLNKPNGLSIVSGGLLTPFLSLQKCKRHPLNPYISSASYKATIVHELAHQYFDQYHLWWSSSKQRNLRYLSLAKAIYTDDYDPPHLGLNLRVPNYGLRQVLLSETFAFCTEYTVARRLWPAHQAALDRFNSWWLERLISKEKKNKLLQDDSVLDRLPGHDFALVIGRLLLKQSPRTWMKRLLSSTTLC